MNFSIPSSYISDIENYILSDTKNYLILASSPYEADMLTKELSFFTKHDVQYFPDREILPFDQFSSDKNVLLNRSKFLKYCTNAKNTIFISSIQNLFSLLPPKYFFQASQELTVNSEIDFNEVLRILNQLGYSRVERVDSLNEYSVRGGIIDINPSHTSHGIRLDFFGDELESIREFNVNTQLSLNEIDSFSLSSGHELPLDENSIGLFKSQWREYFLDIDERNVDLFKSISDGILIDGYEVYLPFFFKEMKLSSFIDYIPNLELISFSNALEVANEYHNYLKERYLIESNEIFRPIPKVEKLFLELETFKEYLERSKKINLKDKSLLFEQKNIFELISDLHDTKSAKNFKKVFIATNNDETLNEVQKIIPNIELINHAEDIKNKSFYLTKQNNLRSQVLDTTLLLHVENIQSFNYQQPVVSDETKSDSLIESIDFNEGDYVVHESYGIGIYEGLKTVATSNHEEEFLEVVYQDNEKLFIPTRQHYLLSKFQRNNIDHPLDSLSSKKWINKKKKIKDKVNDLAIELLDIESKRSISTSIPMRLDLKIDADFNNSFPYQLTKDQLTCINDVYKDLKLIKPMNRVICGDVGFGKTEVAMRATNLVAYNQKQIIILCPSTVLVSQHLETFKIRFKNFPYLIEGLSRHKTVKEKNNIISNFNNKKIDILIGTHALLNSEIDFSNVGLLVIDEEHRFGTKQKEFIKSKQTGIHILSLSATPIPKTLNYIFSGLKDFSYLYSPPSNRISTKTFVKVHENQIIKSSIQREVSRNGQVFYVTNDISQHERSKAYLLELMPNLRIGIAHGQLKKSEIKQEMNAFSTGELDVLICTTIVEMGLDIPNANTIIVDNAHRFGLAQLHQLRGRVGRSSKQAYCYYLIPDKHIPKHADNRLEALSRHSALGAGYFIAQEDLELRGAGQFLGEKQSGHIEEIGLTLYLSILKDCINQLKGIDDKNKIDFEINLGDKSLIPEQYLPSMTDRLKYYRKISACKNVEDIKKISKDLVDQCGKLPTAVNNLLYDAEIALTATEIGISNIYLNSNNFLQFKFINPISDENFKKFMELMNSNLYEFKLNAENKINLKLKSNDARQQIKSFINALI